MIRNLNLLSFAAGAEFVTLLGSSVGNLFESLLARFCRCLFASARLTICLVLVSCNVDASPCNASNPITGAQRLWYDAPAVDWMTQALPIGNGYMGAMVHGGINSEHLQFNEESLWAGGPGSRHDYSGGNREGAHQSLDEVRELIRSRRFEDADNLANKTLTGDILYEHKDETGHDFADFGAYQAFGDIYIDVPGNTKASNYCRWLDLETGTAHVSYDRDDVTHTRRFFASYPSRILIVNLANDADQGQDYTIRLKSLHPVKIIPTKEGLQAVGFVESNGMQFEALVSVRHEGGTIEVGKNSVRIIGANTVALFLTATTDYLPDPPNYTGRKYQALNKKILDAAKRKSVEQLYREHVYDYRSLYARVGLHLIAGSTQADLLPTNERVRRHSRGARDIGLEALLFQFGRYLLISSSRPDTLPANLQGKWNNSVKPPWASDYHFNVNIQMIYWPAEVTNLGQTHEALLSYIETLVQPGQLTAKEHFNSRGWTVNAMNNIFGYTAPGWSLPWGYFPGGSAWLSQHLWEHYQFSGDRGYLRNRAFPIMEQAVLFWMDYLVEDSDGFLSAIPSYSPEHGGISAGASMDIQLVRELFDNYLAASEELGIDSDRTAEVSRMWSQLLPPRIGNWGQLQEWAEDRDDPNDKHRHVSHMFGLYPGRQFSMRETPELAEAARSSLEARGDDGTGWSLAWKVNLWARLKDGDRAYQLLRRAMKEVGPPREQADGSWTTSSGKYESGIYPNLFSTHPPFQLDGNMGLTAGIAEMLVQSHEGVIELLPALPEAWPNGEVRGLRARGGAEVDIVWSDGRLVEFTIKNLHKARKEMHVIVRYGDEEVGLAVGVGAEASKTYPFAK